MAIFNKNNEDKDYFKQLIETSKLADKAALMLEDMIFNLKNSDSIAKDIHKVEQAADDRNHDLMNSLAKAFITPIEREDIMDLSYALDEVIDAIDDVAIRFYMLNIAEAKPEAKEFVRLFCQMSECMTSAFEELHNFKKPKKLVELTIKMEELEEHGDAIYRRAVRNLFMKNETELHTPQGVLEVLKWREMYETLEECCDRFEAIANIMHGVIMKNN